MLCGNWLIFHELLIQSLPHMWLTCESTIRLHCRSTSVLLMLWIFPEGHVWTEIKLASSVHICSRHVFLQWKSFRQQPMGVIALSTLWVSALNKGEGRGQHSSREHTHKNMPLLHKATTHPLLSELFWNSLETKENHSNKIVIFWCVDRQFVLNDQ